MRRFFLATMLILCSMTAIADESSTPVENPSRARTFFRFDIFFSNGGEVSEGDWNNLSIGWGLGGGFAASFDHAKTRIDLGLNWHFARVDGARCSSRSSRCTLGYGNLYAAAMVKLNIGNDTTVLLGPLLGHTVGTESGTSLVNDLNYGFKAVFELPSTRNRPAAQAGFQAWTVPVHIGYSETQDNVWVAALQLGFFF